MANREFQRLEEVSQPLSELTGLLWQAVQIANRAELRIAKPCRDEAQIDFIENTIFKNTFHWFNTEEKQFYSIVHDVNEGMWEIQIFPVLTSDNVAQIIKIHRGQQIKQQQARQNAEHMKRQLAQMTGVVWQFTLREDCLFSPILFLTARKEEKDNVTLFAESLARYCEHNALGVVALTKGRVRGEPYWQIKEEILAPVLEGYYRYCQEQHRREQYRARKLAQKLARLFDASMSIDVAETDSFSDPIFLFIDGTSSQLMDFEQFLLNEQLLIKGWRKTEGRISFEAKHVSLVALERLNAAQALQKQQDQISVTQNECALLLSQLQLVMQTQHFQLRQEILTAVKTTEQRLAQRIEKVGQHIIHALDQRLQRFEKNITTKLQEQKVQIEAIEEIVRRSQEYLIDSHEQQMQQYQAQQQWLEITLSSMTTQVRQALSEGWQQQLQVWLTQQFSSQEQRLQNYLISADGNRHQDALEVALQKFQTEFFEKQKIEMQSYQATLKTYLETQGDKLKQTYEHMTQWQQQFSAFETSFQQQLDQLTAASPQQAVEAIQASGQDSGLNLDWKGLCDNLTNTVPEVLNNKVKLQSVVRDFVHQTCQGNVEVQAIDYLCQQLSSLNQKSKAQTKYNLNLFVESFQRKAKESLQALQLAGQTSSDAGRLGDQFADAAETIADFFSIAIPGLRLIVKATVFGARKFSEYREQCFIDRIDTFLQNENVDELLDYAASNFKERYQYQLMQLTTQGMEALLNHYLLPCLLAEMAKVRNEFALSTEQKKRCMLLSSQNKTPFLPVKLCTLQPRKHPWTAAGLVLGPLIVVGQKRYQRQDNALHIFPWQPRPHRIYGERLGDSEEILQGDYALVSNAEPLMAETSTSTNWTEQTLSIDYLFDHPEVWEEQEFAHVESCWHVLARQGLLVARLKCLLDRIEQNRPELKEQLLASLFLTDARERNILHIYFETQIEIYALYQQLKRFTIKTTACWDQQRDQAGYLPFEYLYQAWQKNPVQARMMQALIEALSAWFAESDIKVLLTIINNYPLVDVLPKLRFTSPHVSPFISVYLRNEKTLLLNLCHEGIFLDCDEQGNSLLHHLVKKDDAPLFESIAAQLSVKSLSFALEMKNQEGDTPLTLAVKSKSTNILWMISQEDRLTNQPHLNETQKSQTFFSRMNINFNLPGSRSLHTLLRNGK